MKGQHEKTVQSCHCSVVFACLHAFPWDKCDMHAFCNEEWVWKQDLCSLCSGIVWGMQHSPWSLGKTLH